MPSTVNDSSSKPFEIAKLVCFWTGVWSPKESNKFYWIRIVSQITVITYIICTIGAMPKGLIHGDLTIKATHVSIGIISLLGAYDVLVLTYSKRFQNFMTVMFEHEKFLNNNPNEFLRKIHRDGVRLFWPTFMFQMIFVNSFITMTWYTGSEMMFTWNQLDHEEECRAADDCSMILIEFWFCPFSVDTFYWSANLIQVFFGCICATLNFERDLYFSNIICYMRCRIRVFAHVLQNLDEFVEKNAGEHGYAEEIDELLRNCVSEHQTIISDFQEIKSMFSWLFFLMVTLNVPIILFGVLLVFKSEQLFHFLGAFIYSSSYAVSHLFMILWQADNLSSESEQVSLKIYNSDWYKLITDQQKVLLMMMMRAQHPFVMNCGFVCFASVSTFVKTIKTVYSFLNAVIKMSN